MRAFPCGCEFNEDWIQPWSKCPLHAAAPKLLEALKACLDFIPGSEVRNWPPGFALKSKALNLARSTIAEAEPVKVWDHDGD